jgi:hypothetical protein
VGFRGIFQGEISPCLFIFVEFVHAYALQSLFLFLPIPCSLARSHLSIATIACVVGCN